MDDTKKNIVPVAVGIAVIIVLALAGFYYWRARKAVPEPSATEALEQVESAAPKVGVPTSPVEGKVPSLNPVDRANPFKYENPLR